MRSLDKSYIYSKLSEIKENYKVDTTKYLRETVSSSTIPYSTIVFINKYYPIPHLATYNKIHERRKNNPLYRNLMNENASIENMALALSSVLTQSLIHGKTLSDEDRKEYYSLMNTDLICESLTDYTINGNTEKLRNTFLEIRNVMKTLF